MLTFFTILTNAKKVKSKVSLNYNTTGKCRNVCLEVQKPKKIRFWTWIYVLCGNAMRQIKAIQNPFYIFINLKLLSLHEITILCWITWISSIIAACSTTGWKLNGVTKNILLQSSMGHEKKCTTYSALGLTCFSQLSGTSGGCKQWRESLCTRFTYWSSTNFDKG